MIDGQEQIRRDNIRLRYESMVLPKFRPEIEKSKAEFKSICEQYITSERKSSLEKIFHYLEKTDFFTAPSSTQFHLNCPGGLCKHSINVFKTAKAINDKILGEDIEHNGAQVPRKYSDESVAVAALFHDLCKIGMYFPEEKFKKDDLTGRWFKYLGWGIDDTLPMGHAEKSLYRLSRLIELKPDEILAIRWHMGMFDMGERGTSLRTSYLSAIDQSALVVILQNADMYAARCLEPTYDLTKYVL